MIYAFIGDCGSGKTLLMTIKAKLKSQEDVPVYSNYGMSFPYHELTRAFFKNYKDFPIFKACVCVDEISMYYSARRSGSKQNQALRPFILQTRKKSLVMYYTAQQMRLVDVNLRENTDGIYFMRIYVKKKGWKKYKLKKEDHEHEDSDTYMMKYSYYTKSLRLKKRGRILRLERFFSLYDTHEVIDFEYADEKPKRQGGRKE